MHVCTVACGNVFSIASPTPTSPSQQTTSTSRRPRLARFAHTPAQNFAPSLACTQIPSTCLIPDMSTPTAMCADRLATCAPSRTLTTMASR